MNNKLTKYKKEVLELVKAEIPDIENPTPPSFWATVVYSYNKGDMVYQTAQALIEVFGEDS
jgi:hypothetical protein